MHFLSVFLIQDNFKTLGRKSNFWMMDLRSAQPPKTSGCHKLATPPVFFWIYKLVCVGIPVESQKSPLTVTHSNIFHYHSMVKEQEQHGAHWHAVAVFIPVQGKGTQAVTENMTRGWHCQNYASPDTNASSTNNSRMDYRRYCEA